MEESSGGSESPLNHRLIIISIWTYTVCDVKMTYLGTA